MGLVQKPLDMKEMNFLDATRRIAINKNMFLPKPPTRAIDAFHQVCLFSTFENHLKIAQINTFNFIFCSNIFTNCMFYLWECPEFHTACGTKEKGWDIDTRGRGASKYSLLSTTWNWVFLCLCCATASIFIWLGIGLELNVSVKGFKPKGQGLCATMLIDLRKTFSLNSIQPSFFTPKFVVVP